MKEVVFRLLRKNKKIYYFTYSTYDFLRPIYKKLLRISPFGFTLDRSVMKVSKNLKKSNCKNIVFLKGEPYFMFDSKYFKYVPFGLDDSALMFDDKKELLIKKIILDNLKKNSVFLDIGANLGFFTVMSSDKLSNGKIYSFEPVKKTFSLLEHNINVNKLNKIVDANRVALSDSDGFLYITTNKSGRNHISNKKIQTEKVKSVKLDSFVKDKKIKKIDVIKCDVEGAELFVLKGAVNTIKKMKPLIILEIQENWTRRFEYSPEEIFWFLKKAGYKYKIISDIGIVNGSKYKNIKKDLTISNNFVFEVNLV